MRYHLPTGDDRLIGCKSIKHYGQRLLVGVLPLSALFRRFVFDKGEVGIFVKSLRKQKLRYKSFSLFTNVLCCLFCKPERAGSIHFVNEPALPGSLDVNLYSIFVN